VNPERAETVFRVVFPEDHPSLPGHFPGHPIVPGVLVLDAVMRVAGLSRSHLLRAKFTAPVGPGDVVDIELTPRSTGHLAFVCRCRGNIVLGGEFACSLP
jgi:3-hydroxymyristoyl/3-hydroxydecanoyl-(acyl carrier protein) dehydratase